MHMRPDGYSLFGFLDLREKTWFHRLNQVQGVGGKLALEILSTHSLERLTHILCQGDKQHLLAISGVGAKLAARMITELQEFAQAELKHFGQEIEGSKVNPVEDEVISALINLGYKKNHVVATLQSIEAHHDFSTLLRLMLNRLGS
jgi:Holliday junction DNA helicase RuvA